VEHLSDAVIRLESFASSTKKKNPVFRDYTGEQYFSIGAELSGSIKERTSKEDPLESVR
jgi:hypothetical protein